MIICSHCAQSNLSRYCRSAAAILMLATLLTGCSNGPPPKLHLLQSMAASDPDANAVKAKRIGSLGMSPVDLPGYATAPQLASLNSDGTVSLNDRHRWAEEPQDAISRVLAEGLREYSGGSVLIEPWPRDYAPAARVEVLFDKLLREPLGGVDMSGQILLLSGDGRRLLKVLPFQFTHYGSAADEGVYFVSVSQGIDDIARMAIKGLRELGVES